MVLPAERPEARLVFAVVAGVPLGVGGVVFALLCPPVFGAARLAPQRWSTAVADRRAAIHAVR